jgi:hypothetical protein
MLDKAAKLSSIIQGFAALVFLYAYFFSAPTQQITDPNVARQMDHPGWLPVTSVVFLAVAVGISSVLNLIALRNHRKIREQIPSISVNGVPVAGPTMVSGAAKKPIAHFVFVGVVSLRVDEKTISRGKTLKIRYLVNSSEDVSDGMWLGASFWDDKRKKSVFNVHQDKPVSLLKGTHEYDRDLTIPADVSLGNHALQANVWRGVVGDSAKSVAIASGGRIEIAVVA